MADLPPNDAELDELLDSALEEFSTPAPPPPRTTAKPAAAAAPAAASSTNAGGNAGGSAGFEDEFMRQLTQGMEGLLKGSDGGSGSAEDSEMRTALDQLLKQMG
ncbi:Peroxisome chaperone and import receptor, partial [Coemansia spiralis]